MENYLNHIRSRLEAIGASPETVSQGVGIARAWLVQSVQNGQSVEDAISQHRNDHLSELLANARRIDQQVRMMQIRPDPVTAPSSPRPQHRANPEESLAELISSLNDLLLQQIPRENPGGGIATPRSVALSRSHSLFIQMYRPVMEFLARIAPVIGDIIDLTEAILGRDISTRERLTGGERALRAGFGVLGLITLAGRLAIGLSRGVARVANRIGSLAQTAGTSSRELVLSVRELANFLPQRDRIARLFQKLEHGVVVRSDEIGLLKDFFVRLQQYYRLLRGASLTAIDASGMVIHRFTSGGGASIRVINRNSEIRLIRCFGQ